MSIAGSSRPASGAEHLISHQLDRIAPNAALHGHQVGVASIVTEYLHSGEGGEWKQVRQALASIDAPTTAAELEVDPEQFLEAMTTAHEIRDRYTILAGGIDEDAAIEAATTTGVL
jgi:glycerol-1-phosphate dehydrogenase [NAD(P)+]